MGVRFVAASTQYLSNAAPPISGVAFTVGMWFQPASVGINQNLWALADTGSTNNYFSFLVPSGNTVRMAVAAGGTSNNLSTTGTVTASAWHFALCRCITSTNRRLSVLFPPGSTEHVQSTTSRAPTGIDTMLIGAFQSSSGVANPFDGVIAEWWLAAGDIVPGNGATRDAMLRQLAYRGPFAMPHVAAALYEYRSMNTIGSNQDRAGEVYFGSARSLWTPSGTLQLAPHPPLPGNYRIADRAFLNVIV